MVIKRDNSYTTFLESFDQKEIRQKILMGISVKDMIHFGYQLMRKNKLHHHFFGNHSLFETAQYLTFFALQLPYTPYLSRAYKYSSYLNIKLSEVEAVNIIELFKKRIENRLPVEYITQEAWYLGRKFYVNEQVLVPRSVMNARFNDFLNGTQWENNRVLDLCTGSGCIGISLALLNENIMVDLVDISKEALTVANTNIENYSSSLESRVNCIQSDLFENVLHKYDLIITNPPYISCSDYEKSPTEFKREPKLALESGRDGLDIIRRILNDAKSYLNPNGKLIAEVGPAAAKLLKKQYPHLPFKWYKYKKPSKKESWFAVECVFQLDANQL